MLNDLRYRLPILMILSMLGCQDPTSSLSPPELRRAIEKGDFSTVQRYVVDGGDLAIRFHATRGDGGQTALHVAAFAGHYDIIELLLAAGLYVDSRDNRGHTPLVEHIRGTPEPRIIELLLKAGAEVNTVNGHGWTALMRASLLNQPTTVKALLDAGADVNVTDRRGNTALHLLTKGIGGDRVPVARLLLAAGANAHSENADGVTFASTALAKENPDLVTDGLKATGR